MKTRILIILLVATITIPLLPPMVSSAHREDPPAFPASNIPPRPSGALTGSQFVESIARLDKDRREQAIMDQLAAGNLPDFLRRLQPVHFSCRSADGTKMNMTIFAMPDYLAIGSNDDFILIPTALRTALEVAVTYGFILPTRKIVDAIFGQSSVHLVPQPLPAGPRMRSTAYYDAHNQQIKKQRQALCCPLGKLISGHKKDVVMTNRLLRRQGKIAIYGWHRPSGDPIQPLTTVHGANYADYSHGIRLISEIVLLDGQPRSIYDILEDPALAPILSDEGPLVRIRDLMAGNRHKAPLRAVGATAMRAALIRP